LGLCLAFSFLLAHFKGGEDDGEGKKEGVGLPPVAQEENCHIWFQRRLMIARSTIDGERKKERRTRSIRQRSQFS
jgi:hypothetical protein